MDALKVVDVKVVARNAGRSVVVGTGFVGAVFIVAEGFVFYQNLSSVFEDFSEIFRYPFGILQDGQLVLNYFLAISGVHVKGKPAIAFLANVSRDTPVRRQVARNANDAVEIWLFNRTSS